MSGLSFIPYADVSALSEDAEKVLIKKLLDQPFFAKDIKIQRLLAYYPNLPLKDKDRAITLFMQEIWKDDKFFEAFRAFDVLLAVAGKRGHFIHQFEVFLFGLNVILMAQERGCDLEKIFKFKDISKIIETWLFASSVHDFGYPIEAGDKIVKKIGDLYSKFGFKKIQEKFKEIEFENIIKNDCNVKKLLIGNEPNTVSANNIGLEVRKSIETSLGISNEEAIVLQERLLKSDDHGYASSIFIYKMLAKKTKKTVGDHNWYLESMRYAFGAVSLHSLKISSNPHKDFTEYINKISLDKNPYAYLLFLVDNMQENYRFLYSDDDWPNYSLHRLSISSTDIMLSYNVKHPTWKAKTRKAFKSYISEKKKLFEIIAPTNPSLGINITLKYTVNTGLSPDDLVIRL